MIWSTIKKERATEELQLFHSALPSRDQAGRSL